MRLRRLIWKCFCFTHILIFVDVDRPTVHSGLLFLWWLAPDVLRLLGIVWKRLERFGFALYLWQLTLINTPLILLPFTPVWDMQECINSLIWFFIILFFLFFRLLCGCSCLYLLAFSLSSVVCFDDFCNVNQFRFICIALVTVDLVLKKLYSIYFFVLFYSISLPLQIDVWCFDNLDSKWSVTIQSHYTISFILKRVQRKPKIIYIYRICWCMWCFYLFSFFYFVICIQKDQQDLWSYTGLILTHNTTETN